MSTYRKSPNLMFLLRIHGTTLVIVLALMLVSAGQLKAVIIANSVTEFSGTQGQLNWYYGYYDGDGPVPYSHLDFELLPRFDGTEWYIQRDWQGPPSYWTALWKRGGHPNALITSGGHQSVEHWVVRRWVSEVSGTINITGKLADLHGGAGDGIVGHILIDGTDVFAHVINDSDFSGIDYNVNATVSVGSLVDFAVAPRSSDWTDGTKFTAVITPEPATLLLLGFGGAIFLRKRRS